MKYTVGNYVCPLSSPSEIKEILNLAKLHELEVIPLVQTFGHMEVSIMTQVACFYLGADWYGLLLPAEFTEMEK